MLIENKWVVYDRRDDAYYTGDREGGPIFESLNSRVRVYKSEKSAKSAIRYIYGTGSERVEFCDLCAVYIEHEDVPDAPEDEPDKDSEMREVTDPSGWEDVFACARPISKSEQELGKFVDFLRIRLCRKIIANVEIFGVRTADDKLYSAGIDGGELALKRFLEEYYNYLLPRVSRQSETTANPEKWERKTVICPICGNTLSENRCWRGCPKYKTSVCEKHCKDCEYYTDYGGTSIVACLFSQKQK